MIEVWRKGPEVFGLVRRVQNTRIFLRMAAIELRRIAEQAPDRAGELRHVAQKLEVEAEDLARRDTDETGLNNRDRSRLQRRGGGQCFTLSK